VASLIVQFLKQEFKRSPLTLVAGLIARPVLTRFADRLDHRRYSGGALLGLRGLVFKAHGSSDAFAFEQALNRAYDAARHGCSNASTIAFLDTLAALPAAAGEDETSQPAVTPSA
jgi:glycerol-3-phosphate acyltransferase PlsX